MNQSRLENRLCTMPTLSPTKDRTVTSWRQICVLPVSPTISYDRTLMEDQLPPMRAAPPQRRA